MERLKAFPLQGATAVALLKQSALIVRLRETLLRCAWADLAALLDSLADAESLQLDEVRAASQEMEDEAIATEMELSTALQQGRSLKILGKKSMYANKTYFVPVSWDHSGLEAGMRRLTRAIASMEGFPGRSQSNADERKVKERKQLLATGQLALTLRQCIFERDYLGLHRALATVEDDALLRSDEVNMAWQEYLCFELERATKALDQPALKVGLAKAAAIGMASVEKPVEKALAVFIDPPEFIINLAATDAYPRSDGHLKLVVKVRGATSLHWVKNDITLREGADGGRIKGVATQELTFTHLLGRDANQKVWCIAENKWGKVQSKQVTLRIESQPMPLQRQNVSAKLDSKTSEDNASGQEHRKRFGAALGALGGSLASLRKSARSAKASVDADDDQIDADLDGPGDSPRAMKLGASLSGLL